MTDYSRGIDSALRAGVEVCVAALLVLPVVFFGGVGPPTEQVIQGAVLLLGAVVAGRRLVLLPVREGLLGRKFVLPIALTALLVVLYGAAMAVPLPHALGKFLSPAATALHDQAAAVGANPGWHPPTAAPAIVWRALAKLATALVFFFISAEVLASAASSARMTTLTVVSGATVSVLALIQFFSGNSTVWGPFLPSGAASFGPFVNRNHFAQWAAMISLCGIGLVMSRLAVEHETGRRMLLAPGRGRLNALTVTLGLCVAATTTGVLLSASLGGVVGLLGGSLFLGVLLSTRRRTGRQGVAVIGLLLVLVTLFFLLGPASERAWQAMQSTGGDPLAARLNRDLLTMIPDYWLVGSGAGSFSKLFLLYRRNPDRYGEYAYAHNDYLQTLIEWGVLGSLGFLALILAWCRKFFKGWYSRRNKTVLLVSAGAAAAVIASLIHAWADFGLRIPAVHLQFAFMAALALRATDLKIASTATTQPSTEVTT